MDNDDGCALSRKLENAVFFVLMRGSGELNRNRAKLYRRRAAADKMPYIRTAMCGGGGDRTLFRSLF